MFLSTVIAFITFSLSRQGDTSKYFKILKKIHFHMISYEKRFSSRKLLGVTFYNSV